MKRKKRMAAVLACFLAIATIFTACKTVGSAPQSTGGQISNKVFNYPQTSSPTTMSSHVQDSGGAQTIIDFTQANLYRWVASSDGTKATLAPDLAADLPTASADGLTWTIKIDPNAKWANGEAINADTFMYSWKMAIDPTLLNSPAGATCASNYITVKNAQAYFTQATTKKPVDWADVGFKKVDDHTVSVTTDSKYTQNDVMMHFWWRTTGPVYQKFYDAGMNSTKSKTTYGQSAEQYMSCGPFQLTSWVQGGDMVLSKNSNYLHAGDIKLNTINVKIVADPGTSMQMYESGQLDYISLDASNIPKYIDDPHIVSSDTATIRDIEINRTDPDVPILHNLDFLHALYYAMDRDTMAKLCYGVPAPLIVSTRSVALTDGTKYRDMPVAKANVPANNGYNPTLAKQLFDKAMAAEGLTKLTLHLNYMTSIPATQTLSEYLQKSLPQIFGADKFTLQIQGLGSDALTTMQAVQSTKANSYELAWMGWNLDAEGFSPAAKFQLYTSNSPRRTANYGNADIDKLYTQATSEAVRNDKQQSANLAAQMEKIFFDQVLNIPVFQVQSYVMFSDKVKLPVKSNLPGYGWGMAFMDIVK